MSDNNENRHIIDKLVREFYALFDNRSGKNVCLDDLSAMLTPDAQIRKWNDEKVELYDLETFASPRLKLLNSGALVDFFECEAINTMQIIGNIAQRWSLYEKSWTEDGKQRCGEGAKSLQFAKIDGRWRIVSIVWEDLPAGSIEKMMVPKSV